MQAARNLLGLFSGVSQFALGIVMAVMDYAASVANPPTLTVGWKIAAILSLGTLAGNNIFKADLTPNSYALLTAAFSTMLPINILLNVTVDFPPEGVSILGMIENALLVYIYVATFMNTTNQTEQVKLTLARSVASVSDIVCRTAASVITLLQTIETWEGPLGEEPALPPIRYTTFFPRVALAEK